MLEKVLIANRGEIAIRIIRACQEMGLESVAIFSDADKDAPYISMVNEAYPLGEASPNASYLNMDLIIDIARESGVEAIHPGYGFLSENNVFARKCLESGIKFIGPPPEVIYKMGDKIEAKKTMSSAGIPILLGYSGEDQNNSYLKRMAKDIGYPIMIKAAAGGGGKGMRIVENPADFATSVEAAKREAKAAFGDSRVFLEKFITKPRHIEFQILGDAHGHVIHLFERECSIQRRHQKIIEETPSSALTPALRLKMGKTAVSAAKAAGYVNAGSVEFLFTSEEEFYFLEVNARLQVEHAITEAVTGIDLVKWQLRIADGQKLTIKQRNVRQRGHAIECRIYAEDPRNQFLPSAGRVHKIKLPQGVNIRHDIGVRSGGEVSTFYDPMIAKLIVYGENRPESIDKMLWALNNYAALGVETNIDFLKECIDHEAFRQGDTYTTFIDEHLSDWLSGVSKAPLEAILATALFEQLSKESSFSSFQVTQPVYGIPEEHSPWKALGRWRLGEGVIQKTEDVLQKTLSAGKKRLKWINPFDKDMEEGNDQATFHQVDLDLYMDEEELDEIAKEGRKTAKRPK
ncbi:MAG: acetyl-CoA carboxylase biotin carboxylase subunit [Candidatus Hodarchaeales archaeon]|jgi:acetyl-CoA carboxylase biotin carboxylase subunit